MGDLRFDAQGASQVYKRQFFIDQHIETKNKFRFRDKTWNKLAVIKWFLKKDGLKIKKLLNCTYNSWSFMFTHFRLLL